MTCALLRTDADNKQRCLHLSFTLQVGFPDEELEGEPAVDGRVGEPLERRPPRQPHPAAEHHRHGALRRVDGERGVVQPPEARPQLGPQIEEEFADWPYDDDGVGANYNVICRCYTGSSRQSRALSAESRNLQVCI